jgi:hypothetical protein
VQSQIIKTSRLTRRSSLIVAGVVIVGLVAPAAADQVSREQDIVSLRLGQHILVDDGSCPAGQIKEIIGSQLTAAGIVAVRNCVPRLGPRKR